jgi:rfaE bifunctional protein kinase chain/domain
MKEIKDVKILVVGDIMLDKYVVGDVSRISPEAPVPIVKVVNEYSTLGGCGNVVRNIAEAGAQVYCMASVAGDDSGKEIIKLLHDIGAYSRVVFNSRVTTVKERFIADQRKVQMLRVDRETTDPIDHGHIIEMFEESMFDCPDKFDIIVVSDYDKGMISYQLMEYLHSLKTPIIVDPKPQNSHHYGMVTMVTPNKDEARELELNDNFYAEFTLVTEGKDGMTLYDRRQGRVTTKIPGEPVEVYNVSGAGDTVVAIMAVCLSLDIYPDKAARVANSCAAYVVTQPGTSVVPQNIIERSMNKFSARM